MLKTNSKKAKENLKKYVFEYAQETTEEDISWCKENNEQYDSRIDPENYIDCCYYIYERFLKEKVTAWECIQHNWNYVSMFEDWTRGLPCNGFFCYWYNREAKDDLQQILEETEEEKNRYTEEQAEKLLTYLIYRELYNGYTKFMKKWEA